LYFFHFNYFIETTKHKIYKPLKIRKDMGLLNKLGIGIGTGLVSLGLLGVPDYSNQGLLENRVSAAEGIKEVKETKPEGYKENYSFDEVKSALGERYTRLSDNQKKAVEYNYKEGNENIKISYNSLIGLLYTKKAIESLSEDEIKELSEFKISGLKKETLDGYLAAFPWIKKENISEIDKDPRNPDKILIFYSEYYKSLDGIGVPDFKIKPLDIMSRVIRDYFGKDKNKDKDQNKN